MSCAWARFTRLTYNSTLSMLTYNSTFIIYFIWWVLNYFQIYVYTIVFPIPFLFYSFRNINIKQVKAIKSLLTLFSSSILQELPSYLVYQPSLPLVYSPARGVHFPGQIQLWCSWWYFHPVRSYLWLLHSVMLSYSCLLCRAYIPDPPGMLKGLCWVSFVSDYLK